MSYPPPQNNPYGGGNPYQQQPPQQPGYGFPQQPAQGGYAYPPPQQPAPAFQQPVQGGYPQQPGFTYPNAPMTMPGTVNAVRIIMFIFGALGVVGAVAQVAINMSSPTPYLPYGVVLLIGLVSLALAVTVILLAARFGTGGNGVRVGSIVYGSVMAVSGLFGLVAIVGVVPLALGVMIIVFMSKDEAQRWFNRQRF